MIKSHYPEQVVFEEALEGLGLFDFSGSIPSPGLGTITAVITSIHWGRLMPISRLEQKAS